MNFKFSAFAITMTLMPAVSFGSGIVYDDLKPWPGINCAWKGDEIYEKYCSDADTLLECTNAATSPCLYHVRKFFPSRLDEPLSSEANRKYYTCVNGCFDQAAARCKEKFAAVQPTDNLDSDIDLLADELTSLTEPLADPGMVEAITTE